MKRSFTPTLEALEDRNLLSAAPIDAAPVAPATVRVDVPAGQTIQILMEAADASQAVPIKGGNVEFEWKVEEGESAPLPERFAADPFANEPDAADYSAIVFVGGWGASSYQYGFSGTYANSAYNGAVDSALDDNNHGTHVAGTIGADPHEVGHLIGLRHDINADQGMELRGQKILQNAPSSEEACHGVTILAWARVDGTAADDVIVDGRIITGPDFDSAAHGSGGGGGAGKVSVHDVSISTHV